MNRDEYEGKKESLTGKVKETAGRVTGNERLEKEGRVPEATLVAIAADRAKVERVCSEVGDDLTRVVVGAHRFPLRRATTVVLAGTPQPGRPR